MLGWYTKAEFPAVYMLDRTSTGYTSQAMTYTWIQHFSRQYSETEARTLHNAYNQSS
jgi:hypothetical protein